jgi:hypothetical protein
MLRLKLEAQTQSQSHFQLFQNYEFIDSILKTKTKNKYDQPPSLFALSGHAYTM